MKQIGPLNVLSDKSWMNTSYVLLKLHLITSQIHYITQHSIDKLRISKTEIRLQDYWIDKHQKHMLK